MAATLTVDPRADYDEGAISLDREIPLSTLANAGRVGAQKYARRGRRVFVPGRHLLARLGTGRHIGPGVSDLHRRGLTAPVETPDGYRAAIQSARGARHSGLSGVWQVADRGGCGAELARALELLKAFPPDPPDQRELFDDCWPPVPAAARPGRALH